MTFGSRYEYILQKIYSTLKYLSKKLSTNRIAVAIPSNFLRSAAESLLCVSTDSNRFKAERSLTLTSLDMS